MFSEGNTEVEEKQNSLFPAGPVIKCFVIPPNSKMKKKNCIKIVCLMPAGAQIFCSLIQGAQPDHMQVKSLSGCFSKELVSFVRPRELEIAKCI